MSEIKEISFSAPSNSLDEVLKSYQKPATIEGPKEEAPVNISFGEPVVKKDTPAPDLSDPKKYYQTGAKKGQPRPQRLKASINQNPEPATISGSVISGALFITLIDLIFPLIIAGINNKFSKVKIEAEKMRMSSAQKKELEPLADKVVEQLNITGNPILLFSVTLLGIYGVNAMQLRLLNSQK